MVTRAGRVLIAAWAVLIGIFLVVPTLFVIPMSFNASRSLGVPNGQWTLRWYHELFTSSEWGSAALVSLKVALLTVVLATGLGTLLAVALVRSRSRWAPAIQVLAISPMVIPVVVIAIGIYITFIRWQLTGSVLGLALAHTVLALPFVVVAVTASARQLDETYELAAASLGAPPFTVFRRIILPLLAPGIVAGALFAFITSWDEIVVAIFLTSPDVRTLPVLMWTQMRATVTPTLAAVGSVLVVISTVGLLAIRILRQDRTSHD